MGKTLNTMRINYRGAGKLREAKAISSAIDALANTVRDKLAAREGS